MKEKEKIQLTKEEFLVYCNTHDTRFMRTLKSPNPLIPDVGEYYNNGVYITVMF